MNTFSVSKHHELDGSIKNNIDFKLNEENLKRINLILSKYPIKNSAILPLLDLAQRQNSGWLCASVIATVTDLLEMPYIRAYEVATFYTMFNLKPVGKYHIQICGTTPCWLKGAHETKENFETELKIKVGETTEDQQFTLSEVECLRACIKAPVVQINE